ncbi:plasmid maintenance system killer [Pseudidiomarina aestuarii]|uniref:Plasmid maintenance system killer n=1 Tax=Pseudidiomarina aestuarii TaxID=624146 RepID=A0A2T4D0U5_9GAMM|nr:plasmid maintenance system killer [Pseudidiomarina aestuarii]PTB87431.1 plasmid maintenance system killer [Pseudidiomarina aestuarii]PTB89513.1 plasmid maintenance system killer [Pseudidiomarina aestuarii]PTB90434.1 plasmid maintenance system killer [Pseudidiomarina aestuarii]
MIKTFADKKTSSFYATGTTNKFPSEIQSRALRKLDYINFASNIDDLKYPPGNRLHKLTGDRVGQYSISINSQWRICFRFEDGDAFDVEICDYH